MSTTAFPLLKTGSRLQYPFRRTAQYSTQVLEFIDGTEQRMPQQASSQLEWQIGLSKLDDGEVNRYTELFDASQAGVRGILFLDPLDSQTYTCALVEPELDVEVDGLGYGSIEITLTEKR